MKHLIKDLKWDWSYGDGGKTNAVCRAKSPSHEYIIRLEAGGDCYVDYRRFDNDEDADNRKDEPPVFGSIKAAQDWVEEVHYPSKMTPWLNHDPLTDTVNWFKKAKPEPTIECECVQQGVMFEEMYELLDSLGLSESDAGRGLKHLAYLFKTKQPYAIKLLANLTNEQHIERLDAMCDIVVTAVGSSYTSKDDFIGALTEVNASNWSKFEDGKAVTDENGKIIKGEGYFKPDLEKFVGGSDEG